MPAFIPCFGTRAQIDATPVADGQFLIATDTGEAFADVGGSRVRLAGESGGGSGSADDDDDDSLFTVWPVVNAALLMSDSVSGGGPGNGVLNAPAVTLEVTGEDLSTSYSTVEA